jgi:hypothetical protein
MYSYQTISVGEESTSQLLEYMYFGFTQSKDEKEK